MVEVTRKVLECDYPGCISDEDVKRYSLTVDRKKLEIDLDDEHAKIVTLADVAQYAHRRPRTRGVEPMDPADIPRIPKRG